MVDPRVNKHVFRGVSKVKSMLLGDGKTPDLYIFSSCVNMIREIKDYKWGDNDSPIKRDDHAMDELRYYVMSLPERKSAPEKFRGNLIEADKRRIRLWMKKS